MSVDLSVNMHLYMHVYVYIHVDQPMYLICQPITVYLSMFHVPIYISLSILPT